MAVKLIHITDLYHPHNDPDDHYDLAQIFALSKWGKIEIEQVIIDYPRTEDYGSPALGAVYQQNILTGSNVHVTVGANVHAFVGKPQLWKNAGKDETRAAEKILEILRTSEEKVYITIVGGCLDTAIALERDPRLFADKCAGIVLNAGNSCTESEEKEYNVMLGEREYAKIFSAPCPIYWNPCIWTVDQWSSSCSTYYRFLQEKVFARIGKRLKNYFLYMLRQDQDGRWLSVLDGEVDREAESRFGSLYRNMWCTGSLFDLAGLTVSETGRIGEKGKIENPVFSYRPIRIHCAEDGTTEWAFDDSSTNRFLFTVNNEECYEAAMTEALAAVLETI